ncbi:hypothetical protein JAAARDRAFT_590379 [Jaapia argillacea MUCL 33604]|uniref:Uncharacterized protein n=1 Tax=Jaapia argillacea MUCL 33604 TaxID=933084 RepID=A0A067PGH4_9AGAM|nr:hypothetical protein JAAARDRAFT_590379 [Jaapia argillacea MUCL 33604]
MDNASIEDVNQPSVNFTTFLPSPPASVTADSPTPTPSQSPAMSDPPYQHLRNGKVSWPSGIPFHRMFTGLKHLHELLQQRPQPRTEDAFPRAFPGHRYISSTLSCAQRALTKGNPQLWEAFIVLGDSKDGLWTKYIAALKTEGSTMLTPPPWLSQSKEFVEEDNIVAQDSELVNPNGGNEIAELEDGTRNKNMARNTVTLWTILWLWTRMTLWTMLCSQSQVCCGPGAVTTPLKLMARSQTYHWRSWTR